MPRYRVEWVRAALILSDPFEVEAASKDEAEDEAIEFLLARGEVTSYFVELEEIKEGAGKTEVEVKFNMGDID